MSPEFRSELDLKYRRLFARAFLKKFDAPMGWHALISQTIKQIDDGISNEDAASFKWIDITESRGHLLIIAKYPLHLDPWLDNLLTTAWDASADICQVCGQYATIQSESGTLCTLHRLSS